MGFVESIVRGAFDLRADLSGTPAPWDNFWYEPVTASSSAGMRVSPERAKRIAAVLACVGIIGRNVAMMPRKIYTDTPDGGKNAVPNHPVNQLLQNPNDRQTGFEFFQMMQGWLELRGNAYAEIVPGSQVAIEQLLPMHPDRVIVEQLPTGRLRYKYNDPLTNGTRVLMQEEVFHPRNFSDDGISGQSTVTLACETFGNALAEQEYAGRFFANDARPGGVIEGTNFETKEAEKQFIESIRRGQTGANRHSNMVLPPNVKYTPITVSPHDSQLVDAQKFSRIQIASIFGVPPHLIGETEKTATYASVEQFNIMFAVQCLLPRVVMWEQAIQRDLILDPSYYAKFSMAALLRGDTTARYQAYQVAIQNGWLSQNDVRLLEDLNPIPEGDTYWRPLNWAPLSQIANPQPVGAPEQTTITDDTGGGNDALSTARFELLMSSIGASK